MAEEILRWALYKEVIKRKKHTKKRKLNTGAAVARQGEDSDEQDDAEGSDEDEEETQTERMPNVPKAKAVTPPPKDVPMQYSRDTTAPVGPTEDGGIREDRYVLTSIMNKAHEPNLLLFKLEVLQEAPCCAVLLETAR